MRLLQQILGAFALLLISTSSALAQGVNHQGKMLDSYEANFAFDSSDRYRFMTFEIYVPAGTVALLGLKRTGGSGDVDFRVGKSRSSRTYDRVGIGSVVASDTSYDDVPALMPFVSDESRTYYIEVYHADSSSGTWRLRYTEFELFPSLMEAIAFGSIKYLAQCIFGGCDSEPSDFEAIAGRALDVGISVLERSSVCSIGSDILVSEAARAVERETGANGYVVAVLSEFLSDFLADAVWTIC